MFGYLWSASSSIRSNKVRSVLTVLGVVIGVSSVTTLVSLGQGVKNDVTSTIRGFGTNIIIVVAGKLEAGSSAGSNPANFISGDILTFADYQAIVATPEIEAVTPISLVPGSLKYGERVATAAVSGAYPSVLDAFEIVRIDRGRMFTTPADGRVIVLGSAVARQLFGDENPIGKKLSFADQEFEVVGTLAKPDKQSVFVSEFESLTIIPFDTATALNKNQVKIFRIVAKARDQADVLAVKEALHGQLVAKHGTEDFTVLTQDDVLDLFNQFLNLSTALVSAIAAISLIVGGIGIMNIMLVTVTERTREIGLRKALGATRGAIVVQFLTEAVLVTMIGGIIGLIFSFVVGAVVAAKTPLKPDISLPVIVIAVGISTVIGIVFGLWPAIRAARKDPVESLRYE